uniref:Uncharacterized protein n=1 Tax=Panagrolaimus sp. ES5 TaxID=591445 RepID=A0AC34FII9_9BILA
MSDFRTELTNFSDNLSCKNNTAAELGIALNYEIEYVILVDYFKCQEATVAAIYRKLGNHSGLINFGITLSRKENGFAVTQKMVKLLEFCTKSLIYLKL